MLKELLYITLFVVGVGVASMIGVFTVGGRMLRSAMFTAGSVGANLLATPYSAVFVTVPNADVAKTISRGLVRNKLAACVNIIPGITSVYEWEGSVNEDSELILMIKTRTSRIDELTKFVRENHPYSVCEVIATSIDKGNPAYLEWIGASVPELIPAGNKPKPSTSSASSSS